MSRYTLDDKKPHYFFDKTNTPRVRVKPGDTVVFDTLEGSGQVQPGWTAEQFLTIDQSRVHALSGPVYVEGAKPGDVLEVEVVKLEHKGWGWTAVWPDFGLLAGEFPRMYLHHCRIADDVCEFKPGISIPFEPVCGVMGVAPAGARVNSHSPGPHGGNLDIRHLTSGTKLYLPVFVDGALFSCGDCHAAQGDGEVNGSGIEAPMIVTLKFGLRKNSLIDGPQFETPAGVPLTACEAGGYYATTAHGPDLFAASQEAVRRMIRHLVAEYTLTAEEAFCLCGAAVDLKISQVVDQPDWLVSAYLPLLIFR